MHTGKLVFSQLMEHLPWHTFRRCVNRYKGNYKVKSFPCSEQFRCMAFAQFTGRTSLRDTETCLRAQAKKLYHMGILNGISRNTLANANGNRDWRIYADFAQSLIRMATDLYHDDGSPLDIENTVYALDSSTVDLCLTLFPWAHFRKTKSAVKLHTLLNLRGNIPDFIHISDGKLHDVNILDQLVLEPGAFYIMDRAYLDFSRLHRLHQSMCFFVLRTKKNTQYRRTDSRKVDRSTTGLICDQTVKLTGIKSKKDFPESLRVVKYRDKERNKKLAFITNNFSLPAMTICELYRNRWHVELFFKWIKQHLRIKKFYGLSENTVKTQIWIAVSVYVLVAIIKKRLNLEARLYTILQILSVTLFEKTPLDQLLTIQPITSPDSVYPNQLKLFN